MSSIGNININMSKMSIPDYLVIDPLQSLVKEWKLLYKHRIKEDKLLQRLYFREKQYYSQNAESPR